MSAMPCLQEEEGGAEGGWEVFCHTKEGGGGRGGRELLYKTKKVGGGGGGRSFVLHRGHHSALSPK